MDNEGEKAELDMVEKSELTEKSIQLPANVVARCSLYQLKMLEDPWQELASKNHQYKLNNCNGLKHRAYVTTEVGKWTKAQNFEQRKKYVPK